MPKPFTDIFRTGRPSPALLKGSITFPVYPALYMPTDMGIAPPRLTKRLWWRVTVFRTKEKMHAYASWRKPENSGRADDFGACVMPLTRLFWPAKKGGRKCVPTQVRPLLGEVLFYRGRVGSSVVTHESLHAATDTLRVCALLEDRPPEICLDLGAEIGESEERLAYLLGSIDRQICIAFHDRRIWK